jgi:hypothetical protein
MSGKITNFNLANYLQNLIQTSFSCLRRCCFETFRKSKSAFIIAGTLRLMIRKDRHPLFEYCFVVIRCPGSRFLRVWSILYRIGRFWGCRLKYIS